MQCEYQRDRVSRDLCSCVGRGIHNSHRSVLQSVQIEGIEADSCSGDDTYARPQLRNMLTCEPMGCHDQRISVVRRRGDLVRSIDPGEVHNCPIANVFLLDT